MAFRRRVLLFLPALILLALPFFVHAEYNARWSYVAYSGPEGTGTIQNIYAVSGQVLGSMFITNTGGIKTIDAYPVKALYTYSDWKDTSGKNLGKRQDIKDPDGTFIVTNYIDLQGRIHIGSPDAAPVVPDPQPTTSQTQSSQDAGQSPQADSLGSSLNGSTNTTAGSGSNSAVSQSVQSSASNGSIVGGSGCSGADCQACNLVGLVQSVINFVIGLSIPIFMGLFAWAGVLYYTSATNPHNIDHAKSIFSTAIFGFVVALGGYLIVNTILHTILDEKQFSGGSWFKVECVKDVYRPRNTNISDLIKEVLGSEPTQTLVNGAVPAPVCPEGAVFSPALSGCVYTNCPTYAGSACFAGTPTYLNTSSTGGRTLTSNELEAKIRKTEPYYAQLQSTCAAQGYSDCTTALAVMAIESTGNATVVSSAGCVGLMQVCPATARGLDPSLAGLSNSQIVAKLQDPTYNMQLGVQYLNQLQDQFGSTDLVVAAYNGGAKANTQSVTCKGQTYWQCTANEGYAETRAYVPNVTAAAALIGQ